MAEITIGQFEPFPTAQGYATDGTYVRGWYSRSFQDSDGVEVQGGNGSTGFYINVQCTVTDGTITVPNLTVRTTIDANDPAPQSIQFSLRFYSNGSPRDWLTGTGGTPSGWVIYNPDPLTSWTFAQLQLLNQNSYLANPPQTFPTTPEMIAYVNSIQYANASSTTKGITYTDPDPAVATHPVVVGTNNYRLTTQGIDIRAFGVVGDGVTDDTTAFQSAINNSPLRRLFIPRTLTIKITSFTGLHIYGKIGLVIEGEKGGSYQDTGSKIIYAGAKHGTLFNIINSGSITLKDLTLSSGGFTEGLSNYADILVNIDKSTDAGTYGTGSTSDVTVENVTLLGGTINTNNPNVNAVGILVNKTGTSNCELMKFRRVSCFFGGTDYNDPTNTLRGQFIQFYNNGNNSLNNVVEDCYCLGAYILYEARNGAQVRFVNNEGNYPSIVYKIAGDGNCQIIGDRTEAHRQFLVATGTAVTLLSNIIPYGGWDATGTYPVIQAVGSTLEMLRNEFIAAHTPGVKYVVGDASSRLRSICNNYLNNAQALADFLTFGQGTQSQSDNVSDGAGVTFNSGYPIIYPGVTGGQTKQSILSSYDYVSQAFYSTFMQHTDVGQGKAIECGADKFIMAKGRITSGLGVGVDAPSSGLSTTKTITAATSTGNKTINTQAGSIRIAAAGSSVVLTNSLIDVNSIISAVLSTNDTTAKSVSYTLASGSVTFNLNAAATAEVEIRWFVSN